jgi:4-amino-4-deoxy-L-arabinose transferase-like glycosyltransferase
MAISTIICWGWRKRFTNTLLLLCRVYVGVGIAIFQNMLDSIVTQSYLVYIFGSVRLLLFLYLLVFLLNYFLLLQYPLSLFLFSFTLLSENILILHENHLLKDHTFVFVLDFLEVFIHLRELSESVSIHVEGGVCNIIIF